MSDERKTQLLTKKLTASTHGTRGHHIANIPITGCTTVELMTCNKKEAKQPANVQKQKVGELGITRPNFTVFLPLHLPYVITTRYTVEYHVPVRIYTFLLFFEATGWITAIIAKRNTRLPDEKEQAPNFNLGASVVSLVPKLLAVHESILTSLCVGNCSIYAAHRSIRTSALVRGLLLCIIH